MLPTLPDHLPAIVAAILANLPKTTLAKREQLAPGDHVVDLDVRLRVRGRLVVGGDVLDRRTAQVRKGSVRLIAEEIDVQP